MEPQVQNMMNSIRNLGLADFVKNFDDDDGFIWSCDPRVDHIGQAVCDDGHSGASFACCLRDCQYFLKNPNEIPVEKHNDNHDNEPENVSALINPIELDREDPMPETVFLMAPDIAPHEPETEHLYVEDTSSLKGSGSEYMFYESMDQNNKNAVDVIASQGMDKAVEYMTKDMISGNMTYGEMRARYG